MNLIIKLLSYFPRLKVWEETAIKKAEDLKNQILMPVGSGVWARIVYAVKTAKMQKEIKKNLKLDQILSIQKYWLQQTISPVDNLDWKSQTKRIDEIIRDRFVPALDNLAKDLNASPMKPKPIVMGFGDSLTDFLRGYSAILDDRANCGIAGLYSELILYTMQQIQPFLPKLGLVPTSIRMGCFVGNALLGYESWTSASQAEIEAIKGARKLFPDAKFLIYGMPPVFDVYAASFENANRMLVTGLIKEDGNAVYLDLQKSFGKGVLLSPQCEFSLEGVHETPEAKRIDDLLMKKGIEAPTGSTIYWNQKKERVEISL